MQNWDNDWRRIASTIYKKPTDSRIMGSVELDVTKLEEYLSALRQKGHKISFTHYFAWLISKGFQEATPEFNTYIKRGKVRLRKSIDASVSVLNKDTFQMSSVTVPSADQYDLIGFAEKLNELISQQKAAQQATSSNKNKFAHIPWPFRNWIYRLIHFLAFDLGISLKVIGLDPSRFGSFILSNIGSIGLDVGYPAILPASDVSVVFTMGKVETKAVYIDDKLEPRRILNMGATMDHRVVDGVHGGRLFRYLKKRLRNLEM